MLRSLNDLEHYAVGAIDGPVGHVADFHVDDASWVVRHLVVDTGYWLTPRKRLIPPAAIGPPNSQDKLLPVSITKAQVEGSPAVDAEPLRSGKSFTGYRVHAIDGEIGHVEALIVDDASWVIRYLIVSTGPWWHGHRVLLAPQWVHTVDWAGSFVSVALMRQEIKDAPAYDPALPLDRQQEVGHYDHYGRPGHWTDGVVLEAEIPRGSRTPHRPAESTGAIGD